MNNDIKAAAEFLNSLNQFLDKHGPLGLLLFVIIIISIIYVIYMIVNKNRYQFQALETELAKNVGLNNKIKSDIKEVSSVTASLSKDIKDVQKEIENTGRETVHYLKILADKYTKNLEIHGASTFLKNSLLVARDTMIRNTLKIANKKKIPSNCKAVLQKEFNNVWNKTLLELQQVCFNKTPLNHFVLDAELNGLPEKVTLLIKNNADINEIISEFDISINEITNHCMNNLTN